MSTNEVSSVYELSLTAAVKIGHFELTQDHLDTDVIKGLHFELTQDNLDSQVTEGLWRSLGLFCFKHLQYGRLLSPQDTRSQDLAV